MEIAANIDVQKYDPIYLGITRSGEWKICERPCARWEVGDQPRAVISPDRTTHGLLAVEQGACRVVHIDAVFPVLHGKTGEDGAVQGLLELSGIPYVGCDIQSSAICMDKSLAYVVARDAGIDTPEFSIVNDAATVSPEEVAYPVFVKPARSGSSFGVSRVQSVNELDAAINAARHYDRKVLIEHAVVGTEVGCAVLGNGSDLTVGEVDQIELRHGFFRIHQETEPEKGSENAHISVPADLPAQQRDRIRQTARSIYTALGCKGLARVDMFLRHDGRVVLNEVNTLPGFTAYSRYPRMMAAAGIDLAEVIDRCISLSMER
jgi:D-alanine--(R)-lactate ligase